MKRNMAYYGIDEIIGSGIRPVVLAALLCAATQLNSAETVFRVGSNAQVTPQELSVLPGYCQYTEIGDLPGLAHIAKTPRLPQWEAILSYRGLHHYCWAMVNVFRSIRVRDRANLHYLRASAVDDIDFVLRGIQSKPDFILRPEIMTMRGDISVKLRKTGDAIRDFQLAIEAKPDYWPAYAGLAQLYKDTGNLAKAREVVDLGLEHSPNSKTLRRLASKFGTATGPSAAKESGGKSRPEKN